MSNPLLEELVSFIHAERERFSTEDSNRFGMAFSKLTRQYRFLLIILGRYKEARDNFVQNTKDLQALLKPGDHPVTQEQDRLLAEGQTLVTHLHLEIESFYLFAKILLDRIAHTIEFYFGQARRLPLDSHDDLVKHLEAYAADKSVKVSPELMKAAMELKGDISDHRDYEIAHEKSPRTMFATGFNDKGQTTIISTKLYPKDRDEQASTQELEKLLAKIDGYLTLVMEFIKTNQNKTRLKTESHTP
jgi:hypothetical protein